MPKITFSQRDAEELRYLAAYGYSASQIAQTTGRPIAQIFRAARTYRVDLGRDRQPWTGPQINRVRELAALGLPYKQIAVLVNRNPTAIEGICHQQKIYIERRLHKVTTSVTDECWSVLCKAAESNGIDPPRMAGVTLEIATRKREMLHDVLPGPTSPAAISSAFQTAPMQARL
jgi:hypothetical protein